MSHIPLLTIIVPTYNRAQYLELLLTTLAHDLADLDGQVCVIVGDNASTDSTPAVVRAFCKRVSAAITIRHAVNVGAEENFCRCVERVSSKYFWIIGDDDLPRAGAILQLLALLGDYAPDLVYLDSDWRPKLTDNQSESPVLAEAQSILGRLDFARRVNVWTTFISGLVVNRDVFVSAQPAESLRRFKNTSLVQLGWVLETLRVGSRFMVTRQKYVLATRGNSGGYGVVTVFGVNFAAVVETVFGTESPITRVMLRRNAVMFLPSLLWSLRLGTVGAFAPENVDSTLRPTLGRSLSFWLLLRPVSLWPRPAAWMVVRACGIVSKFIRVHDRMLAHLGTIMVKA